MSIANKSPTRFKKVAIFLRILGIKNEWGSRGREFKSLHPDQKTLRNQGFFYYQNITAKIRWIFKDNIKKLIRCSYFVQTAIVK